MKISSFTETKKKQEESLKKIEMKKKKSISLEEAKALGHQGKTL